MEVLAKDIIKKGERLLLQSGVTDWKTDSMLLAEYIFGITKSRLLINPDIKVESGIAQTYIDAIEKRCDKIPLQHITGMQEFMGLPFEVNENVLIPRQDTELLVELVLEYIKKSNKTVKVLDMCTGSGCIGISIDKLCEMAEVTASDISGKALEVAKRNNQKNDTNVTLIQSDLFEKITGRYDIIVSNPPYIKRAEIAKLMPEVRDHDPMLALDGDIDGLDFYRKISEKARNYLKPEGMIFYEIGFDQGKEVKDILEQNGFSKVEVKKDLSGNDRVVFARKE